MQRVEHNLRGRVGSAAQVTLRGSRRFLCEQFRQLSQAFDDDSIRHSVVEEMKQVGGHVRLRNSGIRRFPCPVFTYWCSLALIMDTEVMGLCVIAKTRPCTPCCRMGTLLSGRPLGGGEQTAHTCAIALASGRTSDSQYEITQRQVPTTAPPKRRFASTNAKGKRDQHRNRQYRGPLTPPSQTVRGCS